MGKRGADDFKECFQKHGYMTGFLKLSILKLVSEKPMHGYALIKEIEEITQEYWSPSPGSIYPALQHLEEHGLITSQEEERKKVYTITDQGEKALSWSVDHLGKAIDYIRALFPDADF